MKTNDIHALATDTGEKALELLMSHTPEERRTFVTHLECGQQGDRYPANLLHGLSKAGKPLLVRYDLHSIGDAISKRDLASRPADLWRYREFLPVCRAARAGS